MAQKPSNLEQLLDQIAEASGNKEQISLETVIEAIGSRSFGPLLLLIGIILASPLSGIPGLVTTMAILLLLVSLQLLVGKNHFWVPRWLLKRSVDQHKLAKALKFLQPRARFIDRWLKPRQKILVRRNIIAIICVIVALTMPVMELVPFSATSSGVTLAAFGLALIADDGYLALLALAFIFTIFALVIYNLL